MPVPSVSAAVAGTAHPGRILLQHAGQSRKAGRQAEALEARSNLLPLSRARRIAVANGVRHAYTGNVHDGDGGSTYCHGCGGLLIERDWYVLGAWNLAEDGTCRACGTPLAGVFEDRPAHWGARRRPVRLADFVVSGK